MGQREILEFLEINRKTSEDWLTAKEIKLGLQLNRKCNISGIYDDLFKLAVFNLIECKGKGLWTHIKVFRGLNKK